VEVPHRTTKVLVSYAHEIGIDGHRHRALQLTQSLRLRGIEAVIDQFIEHEDPHWPRWMTDQIREADFVLCLASPSYKERFEGRGPADVGRGVRWEGAIATEEMYNNMLNGHKKFISVVLESCAAADIPDVLHPIGRTFYAWPDDDERLYRRLTGQPAVVPVPLGSIVAMPIVGP
jgi:SEFIR domain